MESGRVVGSGVGDCGGALVRVGSLVCVGEAVSVLAGEVGDSVGRCWMGVFVGASAVGREYVGVFPSLARALRGASGLHPAASSATGIRYIHSCLNRVIGVIVSRLCSCPETIRYA